MLIYKTTNVVNGKIYIGKAKGVRTINDYLGSGKLLKAAIIKYGKCNFKRTTIDIADNTIELNQKEIFWIDFYNSRNKNIGYNIAKGGEGWDGLRTVKTKCQMSLAQRGTHNPMFGKRHSDETRRKQSTAMKGRKHSMETKRKIGLATSKALKGRAPWNKGLKLHNRNGNA